MAAAAEASSAVVALLWGLLAALCASVGVVALVLLVCGPTRLLLLLWFSALCPFTDVVVVGVIVAVVVVIALMVDALPGTLFSRGTAFDFTPGLFTGLWLWSMPFVAR